MRRRKAIREIKRGRRHCLSSSVVHEVPDRRKLDEMGYYDYAAAMGIPYFHWGGLGASDRIAELPAIDSSTRVLVVRCGTGYSACRIAKNTSCNLLGVDISSDMVKGAQKKSHRMESRRPCSVSARRCVQAGIP
jgi:SAM-dependent methyltransferase